MSTKLPRYVVAHNGGLRYQRSVPEAIRAMINPETGRAFGPLIRRPIGKQSETSFAKAELEATKMRLRDDEMFRRLAPVGPQLTPAEDAARLAWEAQERARLAAGVETRLEIPTFAEHLKMLGHW